MATDFPRESVETAVTSDRASPVPMPAEDELVKAELARAQSKRRRGRARIIGIVVSAAVIGVVFVVVLPKIASYREVWDVVKTLTWEWVVALIAVTVINVLSNAPPWMAALPGLSLRACAEGDARRLGSVAGCARRYGGRDGDRVRDAQELGSRRAPCRARGRVDEPLEPAREIRVPGYRSRGAGGRGRQEQDTRRSSRWSR